MTRNVATHAPYQSLVPSASYLPRTGLHTLTATGAKKKLF